MTDRPAHEVRHNAGRDRYELYVDGRMIGIAEYRRDGEVLVLPHTIIEPIERGKGWGELLVAAALDDIRRQGRQIVPRCWFVADFVELHPQYSDLLA